MVAYNVHSLIHLVDDYRKHGSLEHISAFHFEDYLGNDILIIKYSHRIMHNCLKLSQSNIVVCPIFTVFTFSHESNRLLNGIGFILSFLCPHYYMQ